MKRRRKPWVLTGLTLLVAAGCGPWVVGWDNPPFLSATWSVFVGNGVIRAMRILVCEDGEGGPWVRFGTWFYPCSLGPFEPADYAQPVPFNISIWPALAVSTIWSGLAWRSALRKHLTGHACPGCSYDLTGNESGICPECGAGVPGPAKQVQP